MDQKKQPPKTISNIVRKLLKSSDISIKRAASYINCTEQSFRNKLSRDSFSIKDIIILCCICDAKLMIDYCAYTDDFDMDFFELPDYLSEDELERIKQLEQQYATEDLCKFAVSLARTLSEDDIKNMSNEDLGKLVKEQFGNKISLFPDEDE